MFYTKEKVGTIVLTSSHTLIWCKGSGELQPTPTYRIKRGFLLLTFSIDGKDLDSNIPLVIRRRRDNKLKVDDFRLSLLRDLVVCKKGRSFL